MSKFLHLCEMYNPENSGDDLIALHDFLYDHGIQSELSDTSLKIDVGGKVISVTVAVEEDAETADPSELSSEVSRMAKDPNDPNNKAAVVVQNQQNQLGKTVVTAAQKRLQQLQKTAQTIK